MSQELLYTSAPRGLKSGTHGFCMVLCSEGMPAPLATALEGLSAYKPVYPVGDPAEDRNPVTAMHVILPAIGRKQHVLSRVASYGLDYSGRPNKLAHHVVLDARDLAPAGPAWMLTQPGVMKPEWSGEPRIAPANRRLPAADIQPAPCRAWAKATGDAGWAGVLAESLMKDPARQAYLIIDPGFDALPLFAEAIALLPPDRRWQATFSTYYTTLPAGATCNWRCLLADSPLVHQSKRHVHALRLDLTGPLGKAPDGEWVEFARTGVKARVAAVARSAAPVAAKSVADLDLDGDSYDLVRPGNEGRGKSRPPRRSRSHQSKNRHLLLVTSGLIAFTAIVAGLILWTSRNPDSITIEKPTDLTVAEVDSTTDSPSPPLPQGPSQKDESGQAPPASTAPLVAATPEAKSKAEPEPEDDRKGASALRMESPDPVEPPKPQPKRVVQWVNIGGSELTLVVPSPLPKENTRQIRFVVPSAVLKDLVSSATLTDSPLHVAVSSKGTLDVAELTRWYTIEFDQSESLLIRLENENRRAKLDGCAIHLAANNGDQFILPLTLSRTDTTLFGSSKERAFGANNRSITVALPFAEITPLPAFELEDLSVRVGETKTRLPQKLTNATPDNAASKRQLLLTQPLRLQPDNLDTIAATLFTEHIEQRLAPEFLPTLSVSLSVDQGKLAYPRALRIEWQIPNDFAGFLGALNERLRSELQVLSRNDAPTIDPPTRSPDGKEKKEKSFALPAQPVSLKPIEIPLSLDLTTLEAMRDQLGRWSKLTKGRRDELAARSEVTADVFRNYVAEIEMLQTSLADYSKRVEQAIQVREDLERAVLVSGSVSYSAIDPNDRKFGVNIPVFEITNSD